MTRYEKQAWYNLVVLGLTLLAFSILLVPFGLRPASGAFGLLGFWGLGPFFLLKGRHSSEVVTDERDALIQKSASQCAFGIFWVFFVLSNMTAWLLNYKSGMISADILPLLVVSGWMVFVLVQSTSTLVGYRRNLA